MRALVNLAAHRVSAPASCPHLFALRAKRYRSCTATKCANPPDSPWPAAETSRAHCGQQGYFATGPNRVSFPPSPPPPPPPPRPPTIRFLGTLHCKERSSEHGTQPEINCIGGFRRRAFPVDSAERKACRLGCITSVRTAAKNPSLCRHKRVQIFLPSPSKVAFSLALRSGHWPDRTRPPARIARTPANFHHVRFGANKCSLLMRAKLQQGGPNIQNQSFCKTVCSPSIGPSFFENLFLRRVQSPPAVPTPCGHV